MKRRLSIFMALVMVLAVGLSGCDMNGISAPEPESDYTMAISMMKSTPLHGNSVKHGHLINSILMNNIEVENVCVDSDGGGGSYGEYVQISGLKNKEIQNSINNDIKDVFYDMYGSMKLPHVYGYAMKEKKLLSSDYEYNCQIYCYTYYNANNIFCIELNKSMYFSSDGDYENFYDRAYLNYDLATGEKITLGDCFEDGFDYITFIDEKIAEYAMESSGSEDYYDPIDYSNIVVTNSFETITPDIDFYPVEYENSLNIVINEKIKGIDYSGWSTSFPIDLGEHNAIAERFASETSLYEDETPNYHLIYRDNSNYLKDYYYYEETIDLPNLIVANEGGISLSIKIPNSAPKELVERAKVLQADDEFIADAISKYYDTFTDGVIPPDLTAFGYLSAYSYRVGDYFILNMSRSMNYNSYEWSTYAYYDQAENATYDSNGKELVLDNIVAAGVDARTLIAETMYSKLLADASLYADEYGNGDLQDIVLAYSPNELKDLCYALYDDIAGFQISLDGIYFGYNDKMGAIREWLGEAADEDGGERAKVINDDVGSWLDYDEIGCDNLIIF